MDETTAVRAGNMATMERIRELLRNGDWAGLGALWAEDGVMELPFAPQGPARTVGKDAIVAANVAAAKMFTRFETPEFTIYPTTDPDVFFAEYRSDAEIKSNGRPYRNSYVGYFRFREGKLAHWKEYFNPGVIREAFGP